METKSQEHMARGFCTPWEMIMLRTADDRAMATSVDKKGNLFSEVIIFLLFFSDVLMCCMAVWCGDLKELTDEMHVVCYLAVAVSNSSSPSL